MTKPRTVKGLGWKHDIPDFRDQYYFQAVYRIGEQEQPTLPAIDLSSAAEMPPIYDQGDLGSCVSNAVAAAFEYDMTKQHLLSSFMPSRLFIYYNGRVLEGTVGQDSGLMVRDGIKAVAQQGVCPETEWSYDPLELTVKPTDQCYIDARKNVATNYYRIQNGNILQLKKCLSVTYPVIFGISVYSSFYDNAATNTGVIPMPNANEDLVGGHCILAVGYDNATNMVKFRNSWGASWGDKGYGYLPYQYVTNNGLASDFWTVRTVT